MAKIQVETIKMTTNAEVVVLNSSFVAKAVRAQCDMLLADQYHPEFVRDKLAGVTKFINELCDAMLGEEGYAEGDTNEQPLSTLPEE